MPAPWTQSDIGSPGVAGTGNESGGMFTITGSGADIGGTTDQFHFVYQTISGDVDIRAEASGLSGPNAGSKGGLMIRESLSANARQAMTAATVGQGFSFIRRATIGGTAAATTRAGSAPGYVRLVRAGNTFTSYISEDGSNWLLVGSDTVTMTQQVYVGLAISSRDNTRTATMALPGVTVQGSSTPPPPSSPWTNSDVGSPSLAGRSSQASGVFSVTGAGRDVWDPSDQFQFMYQTVSGDTEIVARVQSIDRTNDRAKAGVMIRSALTGTAPYAYMFGTPATGWAWRSRVASGVQSVNINGSASATPGWVRLVRRGNTITGYESPDGQAWTMVSSDTFTMPATVYVGLAVTSRAASSLATGTFTNVTIGSGPANQPPTVSLTSPASGSTFSAPASIALAANAADSDGTVSRVDFYNGSTLLGSDTSSPYAFSWSGVAAGTYTLTARATDNSGATTTSSAVTVTVSGGTSNQPPAVALTSPANGATFTAPATVSLAATASDSDGTIARVDFYNGSTLLGSDTSSPYAFTWSSVAAGTYTLTARATDNSGATVTSSGVTITVSSASRPTTVVFTPSADHAAGVTSYSVELRRGSDPVTATPVATTNLGKPTPVNNEISANITAIVDPLAAGTYYAIVKANGPGGTGTSTPSASFTK